MSPDSAPSDHANGVREDDRIEEDVPRKRDGPREARDRHRLCLRCAREILGERDEVFAPERSALETCEERRGKPHGIVSRMARSGSSA